MGINTVHISGQQNNCYEGRGLIKQLLELAKDHIEILVGGGVNADVIYFVNTFLQSLCAPQ